MARLRGARLMNHAHLLAQVSLFDTLQREDLEALAARLAERSYAAGATVFAMGDAGQSMYIVLRGSVAIFLPGSEDDGSRIVLKEALTGEYFGELSLFDDKPRSASVEATTDTVLLELTRADLEEHLARSPAATMALLAEMAERLRETNALLGQRAAKDAIKELEGNRTWSQRLADKVAELNGSWSFILFLLGLTLAWVIVNATSVRFDDYPYQFYNLALAILVALQGPLIVMSQNRQALKDRAQAETDFRVNLKNEVGIESLLHEVSAMRAETTKRLDVLERVLLTERARAEVRPKTSGGPHA